MLPTTLIIVLVVELIMIVYLVLKIRGLNYKTKKLENIIGSKNRTIFKLNKDVEYYKIENNNLKNKLRPNRKSINIRKGDKVNLNTISNQDDLNNCKAIDGINSRESYILRIRIKNGLITKIYTSTVKPRNSFKSVTFSQK